MLAWLIVIGCVVGIIGIYWMRLKDTHKQERVKVKLEQIEGEDAPRSKVKAPDRDTWKKKPVDYKAIHDAFNKADVYYSRGKLEEAHKGFIYVLSLNPDHEDANNKLGLIYLKKDIPNKAEAIFKHLIEVDPKNAVYHSNLALAYYNQGMLPLAKKMYEKTVELDSKRDSRYISLGQVCVELEDFRAAVNAYSKALVLTPRNIDLYFIITDLLIKIQAYDEGLAVMRTLLDMQPYNDEAKAKEREIKMLKGTDPLSKKA